MSKNIVVLVEPEIPANTGNISRTCVATNTALHLVEPLGFELSDKRIKRAGLDYWFDLDLTIWRSLDECMHYFRTQQTHQLVFATTKAPHRYTDFNLNKPVALFFGKETKGLPEDLLFAHPENCVRLPMGKDYRSLNLSNSVAILLYEALRQQGFPNLF